VRLVKEAFKWGRGSRVLGFAVLLLVTGRIALAQAAPVSRSFQASKADVEKALRKLPAYPGGRLPILDGFVIPGESPLERYQQGYYQYSVQLSEASDIETGAKVTAKVTAWYVDEDPSRSGYRSLPSNGRLESDLLDRLQDVLDGKPITPQAATAGKPADQNLASAPNTSTVNSTLPDTASSVKASSVFRSAESLKSALSAKVPSATPETARTVEDSRTRQLEQEAKNLEEILHSQSRPNNLASVKDLKAQVFSRPVAGAKVLFVADAEDEFQVIDAQGDWVHVQISGSSRGWIRRSQLDLSSVTIDIAASDAAIGSSGAETFQQTREETATFPGEWAALRGKKVRIIWVQVNEGRKGSGAEARTSFAKSVFRKTFPELTNESDKVEGVVIVFDSADGGMVATTVPALQRWNTGSLSDDSFWQQCWVDPPEAFGKPAGR
jgi:hypothetical protein